MGAQYYLERENRATKHEIPPRVEYRLTDKGQELTASIISFIALDEKVVLKMI